MFVGQQGSAKTTRCCRIRSLLDPSETAMLGDVEFGNLAQTFHHHAVPTFENVASLNRRQTDMFCRAVTGNGIEKRKLYTDLDQVLYSYRRGIMINAIDVPSTRPDFLDRCLVMHCRRIGAFLPTQQLDRQFEEARPQLLGALLDLLVKTMRALATIPPAREFRMADFAHFGRAVAAAWGKSPTAFDDAYRLNIRHQDLDVLEDSPMTRLLKKFVEGYGREKPWKGTAGALLTELKTVAKHNEDRDAERDLPRSGGWLSSRLGEMTQALSTQGIIITKLPRTKDTRGWELFSDTDANAEATEAVRQEQQGGAHHE